MDPVNEEVAPLDTEEVAQKVRYYLRYNQIHWGTFSRLVLGVGQSRLSILLGKPQPWSKLTRRVQSLYERMDLWMRTKATYGNNPYYKERQQVARGAGRGRGRGRSAKAVKVNRRPRSLFEVEENMEVLRKQSEKMESCTVDTQSHPEEQVSSSNCVGIYHQELGSLCDDLDLQESESACSSSTSTGWDAQNTITFSLLPLEEDCLGLVGNTVEVVTEENLSDTVEVVTEENLSEQVLSSDILLTLNLDLLQEGELVGGTPVQIVNQERQEYAFEVKDEVADF